MGDQLLYNIVVIFAIYWYMGVHISMGVHTSMGVHVSPILNPLNLLLSEKNNENEDFAPLSEINK